MSNFFYKTSDYSLFQKAFRDTSGEDVVVDVLSTDESLKENEVVVQKHVIRKDNRFNQESSFNKFFGPRKSMNRNVDMKDFSSWKNKNYRETEKQIGGGIGDKPKFSFADFMNERSHGKTYNDADKNRDNNQKAINQISSDDPLYKRFSLNDYMRRLEEKTRVNSETRENEDLIESLGETTQEVVPDSYQDENFEENVSNIGVEKFVDDDSFKGEKFAVDKSELDEMKSRLEEIKSKTAEINKLVEETPEPEIPAFNFETFDDEDEEELDENIEESSEVESIEEDTQDSSKNESHIDVKELEENSETEKETEEGQIKEQKDEKTDSAVEEKQQEQAADQINIIQTVQTAGSSQSEEEKSQTDAEEAATKPHDKSEDILKLIDENEKERKDIEEKLKQAEHEKAEAMKVYELRLKELEKSIKEKDREAQKRVLLEKVKNDNRLSEVRAEYESREAEIRRLEKESALKLKIGALLKKELKNNLSISNLEMNNKLLEITSLINQEKERAKVNKQKKTTTKKRKTKRKIDSDIIGGFDFD